MIRKYHNYKLQTNPWDREEEPNNNHETPGRQTRQSNQLSFPNQDEHYQTLFQSINGHYFPIVCFLWISSQLFKLLPNLKGYVASQNLKQNLCFCCSIPPNSYAELDTISFSGAVQHTTILKSYSLILEYIPKT